MNKNFKTELAELSLDMQRICEEQGSCYSCKYRNAESMCLLRVGSKYFDPEAAIAAVEVYRKRKKPRKTVADEAVDIVRVKVTVHRLNRNTASCTLEETLWEIKKGIEYILRGVRVETEILSSERVVLKSHEEGNEDE